MASEESSTQASPSTPDENEYPSGFPQSICDEVPQAKFLCSNCNNVLNEARQTLCGHRYCLACVNWLLRNISELVCSKCTEDPSAEGDASVLTPDQFFSDAAINKEVLSLRVHCVNQGCGWRSILRNFEEHQGQCEFALIPCNIGCGLMVLRKTLASHLDQGCPNNKTPCPSCAHLLSPRELKNHTCHQASETKTKAEKRQKKNPSSGSHKKEACTFSHIGCSFKGSAEKVKEHECSSHVVHLQLLLKSIRCLQPSICSPPPSDDPHLEKKTAPLQQRDGEVEADGGDPGHHRHDHQQLDELMQRVNVMGNIISVFSRDVEKTHNCVLERQGEGLQSQQLILQLERKVEELQQRMLRKDHQLRSLEQSIGAQADVSYDGTFVWRLCGIKQGLREAASGQKISQYSPAFYTSRYGYKVCLRLYLNGDGAGHGTHFSLFFVIMKGDYDAILSWPFKHKVTFFLVDQNHREHVIDAFRPDLSSMSFRRPVSEMNVASGCPLFFPLGRLHSPQHAFLREDTIYIKCVVDTSP